MEITEAKNMPWLFGREAYEIYKQCMYKATFSEYEEEMKSISENPDYRVFVCAASGENACILILKPTDGDSAEITGIAVKKELQNSGIGKFTVFSAARALRLKTVFAETDAEAVGFYTRAGFTAEPFIRHFGDGDAVRYKCRLTVRY